MLNNFFPESCRLRDNVEKYCRAEQATDDNIIRRMRIACWMRRATNTPSGCVVLIAFSLHQWLHERATVLHYTPTACIVPYADVALL